MFTYIIPVKCNVKIIKVRRYPAKGFGLVIIKKPKTSIIIPLWSSYYMPKKPQNTIGKTVLKHYNQFKSLIAESLRWLQITTDTEKKLKVETEVKERDQKLPYFIKIKIIKVVQQKTPEQDIITLPMNAIINSYFNKHTMSWELIHIHIVNPHDSFMKSMCRQETLTGLPKNLPRKIN